MKNENTNHTLWHGLFPRGRSAIISLVIVAVVAFSLGGLFLGGGGSEDNTAGEAQHEHADATDSAKPTMWTCSMHPQIRLPKPGKCPICFMDLIPVQADSGADELNPNQIRLSETAVQLAGIQVTPVTRGFAERSINMVGKLDYDETKVAYVTAWVPGRLDKLFVDYTGARVSKGDHMVDMYSPELISAQEELLQAINAVKALSNTSSAVLKSTAQETLTSSREKLRLYGLSDGQIADIEKAGQPSDHLTIKSPIGGVVVHKDAKEGMYVQTGTKIYTIADLSKLWVILEAYESDLPWLRYGQHMTFTSPSFPGETFNAIISFIDPVVDPKTRTVVVRAVVDNKDNRLKPEMFVSGTVRSRLDNDGNVIAPELAGKWIGPMHPEIVKDHPGKCDICGMDLVPAEKLGFTAGKKTSDKAPLLIPATAPLITGKRAVAYVEVSTEGGPVFEGREIVLGPRAGDYYVVKSGLKEGELVVTNGAFKIDSELQIHAKPSMMSPPSDSPVPAQNVPKGIQAAAETTDKQPAGEYKAGDAKRLDNCEEAQVAITPVYAAYFKVQMALANDDLASANNAFDDIIKRTKSVDGGLFKDEAKTHWAKISGNLIKAAKEGATATDLTVARDAFYHASLAAIEMHDTFGHASDSSYYLTFCPMARDKMGAYWLQQADTVWNSFYGHAMLRCGEIKQELHAGNTDRD